MRNGSGKRWLAVLLSCCLIFTNISIPAFAEEPAVIETPAETPDETPAEPADETPSVSADETPAETPDETPSESADETPDEVTVETPAEPADETPAAHISAFSNESLTGGVLHGIFPRPGRL